MRLVQGFCIRQILDEIVAIPTQEAAQALSGLVSMNETGEFLFQLLQTEQSEESLVCALTEKYDVDDMTAKQDVEAFISVLREKKLLAEETI